ncbi:VOC family protein [Nocardia goodfellowii]
MSGTSCGITGVEAYALLVHDLDEALGFYCGVLGCTRRDDLETRQSVTASVSPPAQPHVRIVLHSPGTDPATAPADRQTIADLMTRGILARRLVFVTDNCATAFERLEAAGAEVLQEPIARPGGVRDCAFFDPSGNLLRFTETRSV